MLDESEGEGSKMNDWVEHTIELDQDARYIREHMNRREYCKAYIRIGKMLIDLVRLQMWIKGMNRQCDGEGAD